VCHKPRRLCYRRPREDVRLRHVRLVAGAGRRRPAQGAVRGRRRQVRGLGRPDACRAAAGVPPRLARRAGRGPVGPRGRHIHRLLDRLPGRCAAQERRRARQHARGQAHRHLRVGRVGRPPGRGQFRQDRHRRLHRRQGRQRLGHHQGAAQRAAVRPRLCRRRQAVLQEVLRRDHGRGAAQPGRRDGLRQQHDEGRRGVRRPARGPRVRRERGRHRGGPGQLYRLAGRRGGQAGRDLHGGGR
ncbi:hypothetical protein EV182_007029, partial [Spiromyces aspiralis]